MSTKQEVVEGPKVVAAPITAAPAQRVSLIAKLATKYSVDPEKMLSTLKATAFKTPAGKAEVSNEQMLALLVVSDQYNLNPWLKEIYAFPDERNGIIPIVGIDGWLRICNEHSQYDGYEVFFAEETVKHNDKAVPIWCEVRMYRKDRSRPITHREWFDEVKRNTGPWGSHPRRMMENKTIIQTARRCFGFGGIYDEDEAARIVEVSANQPAAAALPPALKDLNERSRTVVVDPNAGKGPEKEQPSDPVTATQAAEASEIVPVDPPPAPAVDPRQQGLPVGNDEPQY